MKRLAVLVFPLAAALSPAGLRAQSIPVGPGGELSSLVGLPFDVPIVVDMTARTEKLGAFAARLQWNPAVLRFEAGTKGTFGDLRSNDDSLAFGLVRLAGVNPSGASGQVTLGVARFTPLVNDTTTLVFTLSELFAAGTFADLKPSAVVSNGLYCPARGRFGDIDKDGNANSRDALIALSNAVGLDVSAFDVGLGDVDASGATNARDALIILSSAVGLDVSQFRVLRLAGGSCAANAAIAMSVTPASLDLVLGQQAHLEARAANASGALQTLPDVVWKSSRPSVVAVLNDGTAIARDTGTSVVTASRGVKDSAQATITVIAQRSRHVVDAVAVNATNQLGSAAYPFADIATALRLAKSGDTIEIRPGRYDESVVLDRAIVLLGDTLADGTRPLITGGGPYGNGVSLTGPGTRRLYDLAFDNVDAAVAINGPSSVLLRGVRGTRLGTGVSLSTSVSALRLERSSLIGRGVSGCCGNGVDAGYYNAIDTLVIEDTEIGDFDEEAVYAPRVDSITIRRSTLHDFGYYGLELGGSGTPVSLVVDSSTIQRSYYSLFYVQDLRSGLITRSVLANGDNDDVFEQFQENIPAGGYLILRNDSINVRYYDWLDVSALDSVVIDSLRAALPDADGFIYYVPLVRVTRSSFRDVSSNYVLYVYNGSGGGVVTVTNTSFIGDPRCDLCATVFTYNARTVVDSVTFVNMYQAVETDGDSGLTVTNSLFRRVEYGVQWYGNYYVGCTYCARPTVGMTVRNNTFNGYYYGIEAYDGQILVDSNTFLGGRSFAVVVGGPSGMTVTRNVISGVEDGVDAYPYDSSATTLIADNVLSDIEDYGVYAYGDYYIRTRVEIRRNTITCNAAGARFGDGIDVYYSDGIVTDNRVLGCWSGIYAYSNAGTPRTDSVIANTVSMPANPYGGIVAFYRLRNRISRNVVTADTTGYSSYGGIWARGFTDYYNPTTPRGNALIDSNTVTGGVRYGIYVEDFDTAVVAQNTVQDVNNSYGYGAIAADGYLRNVVAITGNTIRRAKVQGVTTVNYDTATVQVDSNLISASGTIGIDVGAGQITRNTVVNSGTDGIHVYYYALVSLPITLNNISGSVRFGLREDGQGVAAPSNWWGDALGPRCVTGCAPSSLGDSVTPGVSFTPILTAPNPSSPPSSAPRALAVAASRAPVVAAGALPAPEPMPPARTARPMRARPAAQARTVPQPPASLAPQVVQRIQQRLEQRAATAVKRQQLETQREAERAAREGVVRARVERLRAEAAGQRAAARRAPAPAPAPQRQP